MSPGRTTFLADLPVWELFDEATESSPIRYHRYKIDDGPMAYRGWCSKSGPSSPVWVAPCLPSASAAIIHACRARLGEARFREGGPAVPAYLRTVVQDTLFHLFSEESSFDSRGLG